jgi:hypothetical protein
MLRIKKDHLIFDKIIHVTNYIACIFSVILLTVYRIHLLITTLLYWTGNVLGVIISTSPHSV